MQDINQKINAFTKLLSDKKAVKLQNAQLITQAGDIAWSLLVYEVDPQRAADFLETVLKPEALGVQKGLSALHKDCLSILDGSALKSGLDKRGTLDVSNDVVSYYENRVFKTPAKDPSLPTHIENYKKLKRDYYFVDWFLNQARKEGRTDLFIAGLDMMSDAMEATMASPALKNIDLHFAMPIDTSLRQLCRLSGRGPEKDRAVQTCAKLIIAMADFVEKSRDEALDKPAKRELIDLLIKEGKKEFYKIGDVTSGNALKDVYEIIHNGLPDSAQEPAKKPASAKVYNFPDRTPT